MQMREILFRAKDKNTHEWVYGCYVRMLSAAGFVHAILVPAENPDESNTIYPIIPGTVGEYTGLTDKNGKKIFEGDILKISEGNDEDDYVIQKVYAYRGVLCVDYWTPDWDFNALAFLDNDNGFVFEIAGNIHDNPELLGGDKGDQSREAN